MRIASKLRFVMSGAISHRTAIIAVHGVQPHPRYEIQDLVAQELANALRATARFGQSDWVVDVVQPHAPDGSTPQPTISRVHVAEDVDGTKPFIDVIEGYWSPLDKGLTNVRSVSAWLLKSLFVPLNTTAKYACGFRKIMWDFGFLLVAGVVGIALLLAALYSALGAANAIISRQNCQYVGCVFDTPAGFIRNWAANLDLRTICVLAIVAVGSFLLAQALRALFGWITQRGSKAPQQRSWRLLLIAFVSILGLFAIYLGSKLSVSSGTSLGIVAVWFVLSAMSFLGGRVMLSALFVGFFGDVQIYTTRDENSSFFKARSEILDAISNVISHVCSAQACQGLPYDRVFILGHSLGSTVSMDAIIQFYQSCEQGATSWDDFNRLRGFVTVGTALEKTKYFFDVQNPSPSLSYEQWRNDAYGVLFTPDPCDLDEPRDSLNIGIFWSNYWYFLDAVSNSIQSYRSYLLPGESARDAKSIRTEIKASLKPGEACIPRRICLDVPMWHWLSMPSVIPHGDYFSDARFWCSNPILPVLDIVARERLPGRGKSATARLLDAMASGEAPLRSQADGSRREATGGMKASFSRDASGHFIAEKQRFAFRGQIDLSKRVEPVSVSVANKYLDRFIAKGKKPNGKRAGMTPDASADLETTLRGDDEDQRVKTQSNHDETFDA